MKSVRVPPATTLVVAAVAALAACATGQHTAATGPVVVPTTAGNTIPAGTQFDVRVDQPIDASAPTTQVYPAAFTQEIRDQSGKVLVPQGSTAELVVVESKPAGATGTPELTLGVRDVVAHGTRYSIQSQGKQQGSEGLGINTRTGEYVGGGAAVGTVIGAVAGGAKGAVLGGVLGGAAGAATQVLTRGSQVKVPAGSTITFRLDQPWTLKPSGS